MTMLSIAQESTQEHSQPKLNENCEMGNANNDLLTLGSDELMNRTGNNECFKTYKPV